MAYLPISQREARRLRKRVEELERILEQQTERWRGTWPASTCFAQKQLDEVTMARIETARSLRVAVIATVDNGVVKFWGQG